MAGKFARLWNDAQADLLQRAQFTRPDELGQQANAAVAHLGLTLTIYLADHEQHGLHPLQMHDRPDRQSLAVDGTVAGRAFTTINTVEGMEPGHWWVPLINDAERLGVAELAVQRPLLHGEDLGRHAESFCTLLAHLLATKMPYGDTLHRVRRTRTMQASGEMLMAMLPPSTFTCRTMAISAILEPAYDVGGDAYDYAVDAGTARLVILDAMGHGLHAALTSTTALAAMRSARRDGHGLISVAAAADSALVKHFGDMRFVTGVLAELDMHAGRLRYLNAGHPPPVLVRRHQAVTELGAGRRLPLGLGKGQMQVAEHALEPGDRLLFYTDGVVEARDPDGDMFGLTRLIDLTERHAAAQQPAPETLRRLSHSILEHQHGPPADDATIMLVEWSPEAATRAMP